MPGGIHISTEEFKKRSEDVLEFGLILNDIDTDMIFGAVDGTEYENITRTKHFSEWMEINYLQKELCRIGKKLLEKVNNKHFQEMLTLDCLYNHDKILNNNDE